MTKDLTAGSTVFEPARTYAISSVAELSRLVLEQAPSLEEIGRLGKGINSVPLVVREGVRTGLVVDVGLIAGRQAPNPDARFTLDPGDLVAPERVIPELQYRPSDALSGAGAAQAKPDPAPDPEAIAYMRDIFAAHAMSGLVASCLTAQHDIPRQAYDIAELMLKERARRA